MQEVWGHSFAGKKILILIQKNAFCQHGWHFQQRALLTWPELGSSVNITFAQLFAMSTVPESSPKQTLHTVGQRRDDSSILKYRKEYASFLKIKSLTNMACNLKVISNSVKNSICKGLLQKPSSPGYHIPSHRVTDWILQCPYKMMHAR